MNGRKSRGVLLAALVSLSLVPLLGAPSAATPTEPSSAAAPPVALRRQVDQADGKLPLTFE